MLLLAYCFITFASVEPYLVSHPGMISGRSGLRGLPIAMSYYGHAKLASAVTGTLTTSIAAAADRLGAHGSAAYLRS